MFDLKITLVIVSDMALFYELKIMLVILFTNIIFDRNIFQIIDYGLK